MVTSLLFTLLFLLPVMVYGQFECRVNSCLQCTDSSRVNCVVTRPDQYSYNYECRAPSHCLPETVPFHPRGFFCLLNLGILSENNVIFEAERFGFTSTDNCMSVRNSLNTFKGPLRENCLDISIQVSSFQYPRNVFCYCNEDNCQDIINVTLFVEPPSIEPNVSSSVIEATSSPSSNSSSLFIHVPTPPSSASLLSTVDSLSLSLTSSSISSDQTSHLTSSSSLIRSATPTSSIPTTARSCTSPMTIALGKQ